MSVRLDPDYQRDTRDSAMARDDLRNRIAELERVIYAHFHLTVTDNRFVKQNPDMAKIVREFIERMQTREGDE